MRIGGAVARLTLLAVGLFIGAACKDENGPVDGDSPSDVIFPARDVRYGSEVQVLFNQACNFDGCHGEGTHPSSLKLTSWGNTVVMTPGVVVIGDPESSILILRVEGRGPRMPPTGSPLNQNQINGLRTWIAEGAKNN